ncbi:hypothetical protein [Clostridium sp.]|uniref:hypothetical protein n=1 Tax=Clostridium sp. TaxID=1506 RepID=UPI0026281BD1|nr:hypothetical protein [Clostridium sp.]
MEYGKYVFDGYAKVEINNNISQKDLEIAGLHETAHRNLSENTPYGMIVFLINEILRDDDLQKAKRQKLKKISNILEKNMLQVQESFAVFTELTYLKKCRNNEYKPRLVEYRRNQHYYDRCRFKDIEVFMKYEYKGVNQMMRDLAYGAMSIDLDEIDILNNKLDKIMESSNNILKINPNVRFRKLIKYIKDHKIELNEYNSSLIEKIFSSSNVRYRSMDDEFIKQWSTKNILEPLNLKSFDDYITISEEDDPVKYFVQGISAYVSEAKYEIENLKTLEEFMEKGVNHLIYIDKYYNNLYSLLSIDVLRGSIYSYCTNKLSDIISKTNQIILCDRYYYESIMKDNTYLKDNVVFVSLNGYDDICSDFVKGNSDSKYYHCHEINEIYICIFMKGIGHTYFFQIIPKIAIKEFCYNMLEGYEYVNIEDEDTPIDNIFYCEYGDWFYFREILLFITQNTLLQNNLGNRVSFKN